MTRIRSVISSVITDAGIKPSCLSGADLQDDIELQEVQMSPIASIRNRHCPPHGDGGVAPTEPCRCPPGYRIYTRSYQYRTGGLRYRGSSGNVL